MVPERLADRARELAEGGGQGELRVPRAPDEPSADERARHEVTQLTVSKVVCMVRHEERSCRTSFAATVESVNVPDFEMDFCYLFQDRKRRHEPGDQTPVMVDVAAQNPLCAALSTKSDENAYLSGMCAAFVKSGWRVRKQF